MDRTGRRTSTIPTMTPMYNVDVSAREFITRFGMPSNSGQGSGTSVHTANPLSASTSQRDVQVYSNQRCVVKPTSGPYPERTCSRCSRPFYSTAKEYLMMDRCCYHWGSLQYIVTPGVRTNCQMVYTCCWATSGAKGCVETRVHLWGYSRSMPNVRSNVTMAEVPLRQYINLSANAPTFEALLRKYVLSYDQLVCMGYPIQTTVDQKAVVMWRFPKMPIRTPLNNSDVNARECMPRCDRSRDSRQGSGISSVSGESFDTERSLSKSSSQRGAQVFNDQHYIVKPTSGPYLERTCSRCGRPFYTTDTEYITMERCCYHWGKLQHVVPPDLRTSCQMMYTCCQAESGAKGCVEGRVHVWNGVRDGFESFHINQEETEVMKNPLPDGNCGVYALDCEMCYTVRGLELTKVTVVGIDGRLVYDTYVQPDFEIVDYNTRFSGITAKDMERAQAKKLREVKYDLKRFIHANSILIGHSLDNDLRALRMVHYHIVDTAHTFPHHYGLPYRRSLKNLTSSILKRQIQMNGNNSYEGASACMELMLWKVRKDDLG